MPDAPLTSDHAQIAATLVSRRYFAKFDRIPGHLGRVAAVVEDRIRGRLRDEVLA